MRRAKKSGPSHHRNGQRSTDGACKFVPLTRQPLAIGKDRRPRGSQEIPRSHELVWNHRYARGIGRDARTIHVERGGPDCCCTVWWPQHATPYGLPWPPCTQTRRGLNSSRSPRKSLAELRDPNRIGRCTILDAGLSLRRKFVT